MVICIQFTADSQDILYNSKWRRRVVQARKGEKKPCKSLSCKLFVGQLMCYNRVLPTCFRGHPSIFRISMLTTIIYRSHICEDVPVKALEDMVAAANCRNRQFDVTGILLFNGTLFQLLEGPLRTLRRSMSSSAVTHGITTWSSC